MKDVFIHFLKTKNIPGFLFWIILGGFFFIFGLISFVNHYQFRTSALDLGMFNQALYCFAHFKANYFTLNFNAVEVNYFGDHFSPITLLYVPFYYLFGSYALLVVQIAAILFGGYGAYKYASLKIENEYLPLLILIHFFSVWAIYSALSYDFHNNVVGAMLVPWLVYYNDLKNRKMFFLFFLLILLAKENMPLWLVFITIGLILKNKWQDKKFLWFQASLVIFAALYFVLILGVVMPYFRNNEVINNQLARYNGIGGSIPAILTTIWSRPGYFFSLFFVSPDPAELYSGIKFETHFMIMVSGGLLLFFRPYYFVMLLPIYAQKMLSNNYGDWGINCHYSIEFLPIISLCLIDVLSSIKSLRNRMLLAAAFTCSTIYFTYQKIENRKAIWYDKTNSAFYSAQHYKTNLNLTEIYKALDRIEEKASVSCNTNVCPHIASRENLYQFPIVREADYIVLLVSANTYPLSREELERTIENYRKGADYKIEYDKNDLIIFKRNKI